MDSDTYDLVVLGGTGSGIAAAVHAARRGLSACLVTVNARLGAMMAAGLGSTNTSLRYRRETGRISRSPLVDDFYRRVEDHYRETYGEDSEQFADCDRGYVYEPHVAEAISEKLVDAESSLDVRKEYHPVSVERKSREVRAVTFRSFDEESDDPELTLRADAFVDATYEGDLAAVAGVPYRVGRESRGEFGEQYAGRIFTSEGKIYTGSTGVGDDAVQAYNHRDVWTDDPDNRRRPEKPDEYDRTTFLPVDGEEPLDHDSRHPFDHELLPAPYKRTLTEDGIAEIRDHGLAHFLRARRLPNRKWSANVAEIYGGADDYPDGNWERRAEIRERHRDRALGLLYFLQHDDAAPDDVQAEALRWGLPEDEFQDNDNYPWQFYVREARRVEGRATFTEHDARVAEGIDRAPVHEDAVAIAEFPLDSHGCRPVRRPLSRPDGGFKLDELTVPSQVSYRTLLPGGLDNLLVPVALSATHVGFGTIRLEPTWMQLGEAAGVACALAADARVAPADVDHLDLQRELVEAGSTLSYFEGHDPQTDAPWVAAANFLGTKGFFDGYEVRPDDDLTRATAREWARTVAAVLAGDRDVENRDSEAFDATERARRVAESATAESSSEPCTDPLTVGEFAAGIDAHLERAGQKPADCATLADAAGLDESARCSRGDGCRLAYATVETARSERTAE